MRAKTEADIGALEGRKAQLQRVHEEETALAHEQAERQAADATAAVMEGAEKKMKRGTSPGRSRLDTLRKLFEGDSASRMKIRPDAEDLRSSKDSGCAPVTTTRARGRPRKGHGGLLRGMHTNLTL